MNTRRNIIFKVYITFAVFVFFGIMIVSRIVNVQYNHGKYYRSVSDSLTTQFRTIEPIRGNIYSSNERLMVASLPFYQTFIDFKTKYWEDDSLFLNNIDSLSFYLAAFFKDKTKWQYKTELSKARNAKLRYYKFKKELNHYELKMIKSFPILKEGQFNGGLIVKQKSKRIHPFQTLASRTLGYTYIENNTIKGVGLEKAYNEYLQGLSGKRLMQKVSGGIWIPLEYDNSIEPEDGQDLITTIDINIQDFVENALLEGLIKNNAHKGCAVVLEVNTGHIKAISNLEMDKNGEYKEIYNSAIGAATEPGSTFKLASVIALLEKGIVKPNDSVETYEGKRKFYDKTITDSEHDIGKRLTFKQAFEQSSNVGIASLVYDNFKQDPNEFIDEIDKLNITKELGLNIQGEGKPDFKRPGDEGWSGTSLPSMAIGYSVEMTPLQMLTLYNAIANHGKMVKPQLVKEVRKVGKTIKSFPTQVIDDAICSKKTCKYVQEMLEGVVENGTARNIKSSEYKIAGKTGTSRIFFEGEYRNEYQASFVGYFPADAPKYSCIVVIYKPKPEYYGSKVAAPVFKEIADKIYASQIIETDLKPDQNINYAQIPIVRYASNKDIYTLSKNLGLAIDSSASMGDWSKILRYDAEFKTVEKPYAPATIPDVKGMALSDAIYILENLRLKVIAEGYGNVVSQSLNPGEKLIPYSTIKLKLN